MHATGFDLLFDLSNELLGFRSLLVLEAEGLVLQLKMSATLKTLLLTSHLVGTEILLFRLFTSITFSFFLTSAFLLGAGAFLGGILS
jgi:hypothetical protein